MVGSISVYVSMCLFCVLVKSVGSADPPRVSSRVDCHCAAVVACSQRE